MVDNEEDPLAGLYVDEKTEKPIEEAKPKEAEDDPLAGLYVDDKPKTEEEQLEKVTGPYYVPEKSKEELKKLTASERKEYADDLNRMREYQHSKGFTKGLASGATFGATEHIPGLKPEEGELGGGFGQAVGSTLPIGLYSKAFGYPLKAVAAKSPYFKRSLDALAGITSMGAAGGAYHATEHTIKHGELPSTNDVLKHGFEWAALDAILRGAFKTGKFAYDLVRTAEKKGIPQWKVVNEVLTELKDQGLDLNPAEANNFKTQRVAAKAMTIIEEMAEGKAPKERTEVRTVTEKKFKEMDNSLDQLAEPILPEAQEPKLSVNSMVEDAEAKAVRQRIDSIGRRTVEDSELGKQIQEGINTAREDAKAQYKPFYDEVDEGARYITTTPKQSAQRAGDLVKTLEELKTRATGDTTVINSLEDVLEDLGYTVQRKKAPKGKKGPIELIVQNGEVPLPKLMQLGRKLNEVVRYDSLDKIASDKLKKIATDIKQDIRTALKKEPDLLAAFELAEEAFGVNAEKFGRDSIRKIRSTEALEGIVKNIESATALKDLRSVLQPSTMKNVERQLLEKMNKMSHHKAEDFLRKIKSGMSKESQQVADQIVQSKVPINKQSIRGRRDRLHEVIDDDLVTAMNTGKRPNQVLDLWQNPRGQKLVKEALATHPQKKELIKYLQDQTLNDMARSIVSKDGTIELAKLNELMNNPAIRNNLEQLGGKEAVEFFEKLSERSKNLKKNAQELVTEKLGSPKGEKGKFETPAQKSTGEKGKGILKRQATTDFPVAAKVKQGLDFLGANGRLTLNLFTLMKFGFPKAVLIPLTTRLIQRMATSPKVRRAFIHASQKNLDPLAFITALEALDTAAEED